MHAVTVDGLRKEFSTKKGPVVALESLDLQIEAGEMVVLLGPSGCGKTTALRCLAGLETPHAGRITFGDRAVFDAGRLMVPPERRGVGMVFQSYALWPHLTVRKNIGFPLNNRRSRTSSRDPEAVVTEMARLVGCEHLLSRYPSQLSGGQQQRIALARGLVGEPALVLFDEPLSNLDAQLRNQLRSEITRLRRELSFTGLYVTHDQEEAYALADRIVVLRDARVEQVDTPQAIYARPATEHVATFTGRTNHVGLSDDVRARFRPVETHVGRPGRAEDLVFRGEVTGAIYCGSFWQVEVSVRPGDVLTAHVPGSKAPALGEVVPVHVAAEDVAVFDSAGIALDPEQRRHLTMPTADDVPVP